MNKVNIYSKQVAAEIASSAAPFYVISVTALLTNLQCILNNFHCRCLGTLAELLLTVSVKILASVEVLLDRSFR